MNVLRLDDVLFYSSCHCIVANEQRVRYRGIEKILAQITAWNFFSNLFAHFRTAGKVSKLMCNGYVSRDWTHRNSSYPQLFPIRVWNHWLRSASKMCFLQNDRVYRRRRKLGGLGLYSQRLSSILVRQTLRFCDRERSQEKARGKRAAELWEFATGI